MPDKIAILQTARRAAAAALGPGATLCPVTGGTKHHVFRAELPSGASYCLRLGFSPDSAAHFELAAKLHDALRPACPAVPCLGIGQEGAAAWALCPWMPGQELCCIHGALGQAGLQNLAAQMQAMQRRVASLFPFPGKAGLARDPFLREDGPDWNEWVLEAFRRQELACQANPASRGVAQNAPKAVELALRLSAAGAFSAPPAAFLWDCADRNVLIGPSGDILAVVDADQIGFGDPLVSAALARVSLFERWGSLAYADALFALENPGLREKAAYCAYQALYCLWFAAKNRTPAPKGTALFKFDARAIEALFSQTLLHMQALLRQM